MENVLKNELDYQTSELNSIKNQNSWSYFFGLQKLTIDEKYQQQCIKELEKILINRQQLDRTIKDNYVVCFSNLSLTCLDKIKIIYIYIYIYK
mgnify:CR=1 FL=1